jgi:hypothetical protein
VAGQTNIALARSDAEGRARTELARSLQTRVKAMLKDYQAATTGGANNASASEQHIEDVSKQITDTTLAGTRLEDTWISNSGTFWALVVLDVDAFRDGIKGMNQLDDKTRAAIVQRADRAFAELDDAPGPSAPAPAPPPPVEAAPQVAVEQYWVDWTSATPGQNGSAVGTLTAPSGRQVTVSYAGEVMAAQTKGGTNYWNPATAYTTNNVVANAPPAADIIQLNGGNTRVNTITFSEPITNPVMAIVSLGAPSAPCTYNFDAEFDLLSSGHGYWGNGPLAKLPGNILEGREGHGVIQFRGTFSKISWTVPKAEHWHGFQVGARLR